MSEDKKRTSNLQKWAPYTMDAADKISDDLKSGASFWKPEAGKKNVCRMLPALPGERYPYIVVWEHFVELPELGSKVRLACARVMAKQPCLGCAAAEKLSKTGNPIDRKAAEDMSARKRLYSSVVDRMEPDRGVLLWAFGVMIHGELKTLLQHKGDFTDPTEKGYDLIVDRKGSGRFDTEYKVIDGDRCALGDMSWLDQRHDLTRFSRVLTIDQQKAALRGEQVGGDEGAPVVQQRKSGGTTIDDVIDGVLDE